jgi:hypothetical protein
MRSTQRYVAYQFFVLRCALSTCRAVHRTLMVLVCAALIAAASATPVQAQAQELIVDGGFELGGVNWAVSSTFASANSGGWFLSAAGNPAPLSGLPTEADGGGAGLMVVSDQLATGTMALFQTFTVPADFVMPELLLSFDMFVNDWSNQPTFNASQHSRVDITAATGTGHLATSIFNAYLGTDGGPLPNEFRHYEFDILPFVTPGQSYRVRFQTVVGISQLTQGVDNVSVLAVPEPSAWALTCVGLTTLAGGAVRKRRKPIERG